VRNEALIIPPTSMEASRFRRLSSSVDCGGLLIGLQIAGKPLDERMVLRVAHAYERRHDWTSRQPQL
jgi:Asp-tRNA(Asn)/Glu-tRNA(Gln) amidotransferase A subunit family amidase